MPLPIPTYVDGSWTVAAPCSVPRFEAPLPGILDELILYQDFQQQSQAFVPQNIGGANGLIAHPDFASYYLMEETPLQDAGGGWVRWTRVYVKKPASHNEYEHFSYRFPGIWETSQSAVVLPGLAIYGRLPVTETVLSQVRHDYFLIAAGGAPADFADASNIPAITRFAPFVTGIPGQYVDSVADLSSYYGILTFQTTPGTTQYKGFITDATNNGWGATSGGLLVAEPSRLSRWKGNVWLRQTRYVQAI